MIRTIDEIKLVLKQKSTSFPVFFLTTIESFLNEAIRNGNEEKANYFWCLREVFVIQSHFTTAFHYLETGKFEDAWLLFDHVDTDISFLEENVEWFESLEPYNIAFILSQTKEFQKLFPYKYFLSRESLIKEEKCSICGKTRLLRHPCKHIPGKLYMGKLCLRDITKMELKALCIVKNPFDKYTFISIPNHEYNYGMLKKLLTVIKNPYDSFRVVVTKKTKPAYAKAKKQSPCPCGSGKKYKRCHLGTADELMDHYLILTSKCEQGKTDPSYFSTWT